MYSLRKKSQLSSAEITWTACAKGGGREKTCSVYFGRFHEIGDVIMKFSKCYADFKLYIFFLLKHYIFRFHMYRLIYTWLSMKKISLKYVEWKYDFFGKFEQFFCSLNSHENNYKLNDISSYWDLSVWIFMSGLFFQCINIMIRVTSKWKMVQYDCPVQHLNTESFL